MYPAPDNRPRWQTVTSPPVQRTDGQTAFGPKPAAVFSNSVMNQSIATTPMSWFARGFFVGILIMSSMIASSYFFRSESGGNLLGTRPNHREALGVSLRGLGKWNMYGGYFVDYLALLVDGLCAVMVGAICGLIAVRHRVRLNSLVAALEKTPDQPSRSHLQFSLRGMLLATGLVALMAATARYALAGQAESLGVIYLLGPWVLVLIALLPLGLAWQQRVLILIPTTVLLIAAAVVVGLSLKPRLEFDKVLMAIFICWTPQCVLAAIGLMARLILQHAPSIRTDVADHTEADG